MMTSSSIEIRFIHSKNSAAKDEVVLIKKDFSSNSFNVTYTDPNKGTPYTYSLTGLYQKKLMDYVYMLFKNQKVDEEGCSDIQVNVPSMPTMIISTEKIHDLYYRDHLYELVELGVDLLDDVSVKRQETFPAYDTTTRMNDETVFYTPKVSRRSTAPGEVPSHLFFD
jgi:hypothetical protein